MVSCCAAVELYPDAATQWARAEAAPSPPCLPRPRWRGDALPALAGAGTRWNAFHPIAPPTSPAPCAPVVFRSHACNRLVRVPCVPGPLPVAGTGGGWLGCLFGTTGE